MSNKNEKLNQKLKEKYIKNIYNFELLYSKKKISQNKGSFKGYLINLNDYNDIKEKIGYEKYNKNNIEFDYNISDSEKYFKVKQIEFKTCNYLMNMIYYENKYIIINEDLWKVLCEKGRENDEPINYEFGINKLIIKLDNKKNLDFSYFPNKDNIIIISKSKFLNDNKYDYSNYNKINKIYNQIKLYYEFEKDFLEDLSKPKNDNCNIKKTAYLVNKNWLDKWMTYSHYVSLKNYSFKKNKQNIINKIIFFLEQDKFNYDELNNYEILNFNQNNEIESYLKNNSLAIVNDKFLSSFKKSSGKIIKYIAYENKINIYLNETIYSTFSSTNNIISLNSSINNNNPSNILSTNDNNNNLLYLNLLIKIYYFQKKLNEQINSQKNSTESNNYLINKNIINKFKDFFNYNELYILLKDNNTINSEIDYKNLEDKIGGLKEYKNEINQKIITTEFNSIDSNIKEEIYLSQKKYITDIDIINEDIKSFFIENNIIKKEKIIKCDYIAGYNKIFIFFIYQNKTFFELGYINYDGNFIIEYLIEPKNGYNDITSIFHNNGIENVIKNNFINNNEIKNGENLIGYYYKIEQNNNKQLINEEKDKINNINKNENNNFINDILLILISIYLFEKDLQSMISMSKSEVQNKNKLVIKDCFLINKNIISEFKNLCSYNEIMNYINKLGIISYSDIEKINSNKNNFDLKLNKKDDNLIKIEKENINIDKEIIKINSIDYYYPINFNILSKNIFEKICKVLKIKIEQNKIDELSVDLGFKNQKIYLNPKNNNFFNNKNKYFIYEYSLTINNKFYYYNI